MVLTPTAFNKVEDLSADLNETNPVQDQYHYQQFSSPGKLYKILYVRLG